jgi:predicted phage-related endonuclease
MKLIPKPIHGSQEWLLTRWKDENGQCVFGASDIPALMNASPYSNRSALLADKLSEPVVKPTNAVFERGNLLESPLLINASRVLGTEITTPEFVYRDGRLSISLDGVDNAASPNVVVEAKTTTKYSVSSSDDLPAEKHLRLKRSSLEASLIPAICLNSIKRICKTFLRMT